MLTSSSCCCLLYYDVARDQASSTIYLLLHDLHNATRNETEIRPIDGTALLLLLLPSYYPHTHIIIRTKQKIIYCIVCGKLQQEEGVLHANKRLAHYTLDKHQNEFYCPLPV